METLIVYVAIGAIFSIIIGMIIEKNENKSKVDTLLSIVIGLVWPYALLMFIKNIVLILLDPDSEINADSDSDYYSESDM